MAEKRKGTDSDRAAKPVEAPEAKQGAIVIDTDLSSDQRDYVEKLIEAQEKAYDPNTVIGGPRPKSVD